MHAILKGAAIISCLMMAGTAHAQSAGGATREVHGFLVTSTSPVSAMILDPAQMGVDAAGGAALTNQRAAFAQGKSSPTYAAIYTAAAYAALQGVAFDDDATVAEANALLAARSDAWVRADVARRQR